MQETNKRPLRLLMENWRRFLTEAQVSYSGILKLTPSPSLVAELSQLSLPEGAVALPVEKLHVTLIHQSFLKPYRKEIKEMEFPEAPEPRLVRMPDGSPELREADDGPKRSWVVFLDDKSQEEMQAYVNEALQALGASPNPEPDRRYHISVANLTGKTTDSVRYP